MADGQAKCKVMIAMVVDDCGFTRTYIDLQTYVNVASFPSPSSLLFARCSFTQRPLAFRLFAVCVDDLESVDEEILPCKKTGAILQLTHTCKVCPLSRTCSPNGSPSYILGSGADGFECDDVVDE